MQRQVKEPPGIRNPPEYLQQTQKVAREALEPYAPVLRTLAYLRLPSCPVFPLLYT
jgi:hypothetical protein